jgi:poly(A) polymerase
MGQIPLPVPYSQGLFAPVLLLFISYSCNSTVHLLKIQIVLTCSLQLESNGIECDPDSSQEVDHTVIKPNIVYHWGLISQTFTYLDISSLKEDFMKNVINDVYGKVKCTQSELTMSIVGPSELPKSLYGDSFYSQHLPRHVVGYQAATDCWSAVG